MAKNLPAMRETWVRSLGWEDPLEEEMVIPSSILAWIIPQTEHLLTQKQLNLDKFTEETEGSDCNY